MRGIAVRMLLLSLMALAVLACAPAATLQNCMILARGEAVNVGNGERWPVVTMRCVPIDVPTAPPQAPGAAR